MRQSQEQIFFNSERKGSGFLKIVNCLVLLFIVGFIPKVAEAYVFEDRIATAKAIAHYTMGHIYDLQGMTEQAIWEYQEASHFDPESYSIRLRLGADYARLNMLDQAVPELTQVQNLYPEDIQSHYLLALIYSTQKKYDKAANEYEIILKKFSSAEPENIEIYGYLGQLYYSEKKYDQAISQYEKVIQFDPKNTDVLYLLGSLYLEVDRKPKAMEVLKKSIAINPDHDGSLNTLAYIYAEENINLDEAQDLVERALKIDPHNGAYLDSLGWVYYKKGMYQKALDTLTKANEIMQDPVIYDHMGDVCLKLNRINDASKNWQKALELAPGEESIQKKISNLKNNSTQVSSR